MTSRAPRPFPTSAALAAAMTLCMPRNSAKADGSVAYKYEDYREDDNRITVVTSSSSFDQDVGAFGHMKLTGTIDAVSGATPTGQPAPPGSDQVVLSQIHTRRKAWSGDYSQQFSNVNIDVGFADSRESDYVSRGWSVSTLTDFNEKNTTLRLGVAGTDNDVEIFYLASAPFLNKTTHDAILGVTQLIDPLTSVTFNVSGGRDTGYLSEPHKDVTKSIEIVQNIFLLQAFAENSPSERNKGNVYASINRAFPSVAGALEGSYRFYADTWGVTANTAEVDWYQHLGSKLILKPSVRIYQQSAAKFYYYNLDNTPIIPVRVPDGSGPNYSSDFRLSAMQNVEYGVKLVWNPADRMQLELAYERYEIWGTDGVTPKSAYPSAGITTVGARFSW